jgi:hypothetical protein
MNWQRGRSYGQDRRDKMFAAIDRGLDPKAVASAFTVSVSWIYQTVDRRRQTVRRRRRFGAGDDTRVDPGTATLIGSP